MKKRTLLVTGLTGFIAASLSTVDAPAYAQEKKLFVCCGELLHHWRSGKAGRR